MVLLYYDPLFLQHDTGSHPENSARLSTTWQHLRDGHWVSKCRQVEWQPADLEQLSLIHDRDYLAALEQVCDRGGGRVEADTTTSRQSFAAARLAAGAVGDAVDRILAADTRRAVCLLRPPGHHALRDRPMGFCLIGNVAYGAARATRIGGLDSVLVVDWDVHHGNGTQALFWDDPEVGFYSIHRWPFYPGTGDRDETGTGRGLGRTCNVPVEFGIKRSEFLATFRSTLQDFADRVRPQLVLISAGFDAHQLDPVGSLGLKSEDFGELTSIVVEIADRWCEGRLISVLEGGYHPTALAESVELHLSGLLLTDGT